MKELVVVSGKGGTGKTSLVACLASLARDKVLADCDVDAANLHLVLAPATERVVPFSAGRRAEIRTEDCTACGECAELCRFGAVVATDDADGAGYRIDPLACEGCGVCVRFCPAGAVDFPTVRCGEWRLSHTRHGPLVHADLDVGAENSGKLVTAVRREARRVAETTGRDLVLVDGPPGIGCPASAALTGADLALMVTEPSLSGLHDLARALDLAAHFDVPAVVAVNRWDLSPRLTRDTERYCRGRDVPVLARVPHDMRFGAAQRTGRSLLEHAPDGAAAAAIRALWRRLERRLDTAPVA